MKKIYLLTLSLFSVLTLSAQWTVENLSSARYALSSVQVGDSLLFIGGQLGNNDRSSTIDIYNTATQSWETPMNLSEARSYSAAVKGDSAIYIAGGITNSHPFRSNIVDIYKNGIWTTHTLPERIAIAQAVHVGSKIMIAGGTAYGANQYFRTNKVQIYDELTGVWSTDTLTVGRSEIGVATDGNIALFAGGMSGVNEITNRVDIYNYATDSWSIDSLSQAKTFVGGAYLDGKFYLAGGGMMGNTSTDLVEIYDGANWTTDTLSKARAGIACVVIGNTVAFTGGGNLDVSNDSYNSYTKAAELYNTSTDTWTNNYLNYSQYGHTAIAANGKIYVAGGAGSSGIQSRIHISDFPLAINDMENSIFTIYPNPTNSAINIKVAENQDVLEVVVRDIAGRICSAEKFNTTDMISIDIKGASGIYFIALTNGLERKIVKVIKQ